MCHRSWRRVYMAETHMAQIQLEASQLEVSLMAKPQSKASKLEASQLTKRRKRQVSRHAYSVMFTNLDKLCLFTSYK